MDLDLSFVLSRQHSFLSFFVIPLNSFFHTQIPTVGPDFDMCHRISETSMEGDGLKTRKETYVWTNWYFPPRFA